MRHLDSIESVIKSFYVIKKSAAKTTSELDKRIVDGALIAQEKSKKTQSAATQPNIWRIIMKKSRITKLASAAAVIIIMVLFTINSLDDTTAWAQIARALDEVENARIDMKIITANGNLEEQQYFFKKPYFLREERPEYIAIDDGVSFLLLNKQNKTAQFRDSLSEWQPISKHPEFKILGLFRRKHTEGFELKKLIGESNETTLVYSVKYQEFATGKAWVDAATMLPLRMEVTLSGELEPNAAKEGEAVFSYDPISDEVFSMEIPAGYEELPREKSGVMEGKVINRANTVFAAAMDSMRQARTFSCIVIFEVGYKDGGKRGKYLLKQKLMFKEPDRERNELLTSAPPWPQDVGKVTIWHYGKRQRLQFKPFDKTAEFHDMSSDYVIDEKTGELKLTQLDTGLRDQLLEWSAGAVEDIGRFELEGQSVRMLRSRKDKRITTVWVNPETSYPVQIEHKWTDQSRSPVMYTSIQIDTELDDDLFSLEPPEGYTLSMDKLDWPDEKKKMMTKVMRLGLWCVIYANDNDDQFPGELADLVKAGIITDEVLKTVLAAPDEPDGPPVIRYRKPDKDAERSSEVILFEIFDQWPQDRVVACFADGHSELIPVQTLVQLLKPWPEYKKKLSLKMTHLHWLCEKYAKEHEGQYPGELEDLIGGKFSDETIKRLQAVSDQPEGAVVIRYRSPRANADPSTEVILFEIYDQWPEDNAVVCYADGHCEIIPDQNRFEELIR